MPLNFNKQNFFTIMTDECADGANKKQLVIYFRYVDEMLMCMKNSLGSMSIQTY